MSKSNKSNRAPKILEPIVNVEQPSVEQLLEQVDPSVLEAIDKIMEPSNTTTNEPEPAVIAQVQSEQSHTSTLDDKGRIRVVSFTQEEWADIKKSNGLGSTSAQMRYLVGRNYSPSATATFLGKRYQHVRNVMNQILKRPS